MAISGSSIGHHQGQNVSNSGEEMRSPSFSHPPLDEKVDEAGWGCTLTFLFSANVQEHPRRTMTLLRTAHLLPQRDPELFSSALSTMCTGSHWDLLTKDSPVISLNLLYFTGSPCLLSWMKTDKADAIFSCLPPPPPSVLSHFSLPQIIFWFGFSFPISSWTRRELHSLGYESGTEVGGNWENWLAFIYLFFNEQKFQPKGWGYVYSQTELCQRNGRNFVGFFDVYLLFPGFP